MRILLTLTALAALSLANAKAVDDKTFFSGAHIGMTIDECMAYYYPHGIPAGLIEAMMTHGGIHGIGDRAAAASPGAISDAGSYWFSGAPDGEQRIDFRTNSNPQGDRHVEIYFRESDRKVVSVEYWKMSGDQTFDRDLIDYLVHLNRGRGLGVIVSKFYGGTVGQFIIKTEEQEKVEEGQIKYSSIHGA
jgi:hypothetical protein